MRCGFWLHFSGGVWGRIRAGLRWVVAPGEWGEQVGAAGLAGRGGGRWVMLPGLVLGACTAAWAQPKPECSFCSQQISGKYFIPKHWRTPRPTPLRIQVRALGCTGIQRGEGGVSAPLWGQAHSVGAGTRMTHSGTAPGGWGGETAGPPGAAGAVPGAVSWHLMAVSPQGCARRPACSAIHTVTPHCCSGLDLWGRASCCPPRRCHSSCQRRRPAPWGTSRSAGAPVG